MTSQTDLAERVASRICHDLVNPLGAVGNGVELLGLTGGGGEMEISLIRDSLENALARLQCFRLAFGAGNDRIINGTEICALFNALSANGRVRFDWQAEDMQRKALQIVLLAALCVETALPFGGKVSMTTDGQSWTVQGNGDRAGLSDEAAAILTDPDGDSGRPALVHIALLAALTKDRPPEITTGEEIFTITLRL